MTSYPRKAKLFVAWSKAMVDGATVDKPSYPGTSVQKKTSAHKRRRRRKKRKKKNAAKE